MISKSNASPSKPKQRSTSSNPENGWVMVETFHHSYGLGKEAKIEIVQNQVTLKYLARCYRKMDNKWVAWPNLELMSSSRWDEVLDDAVKRINTVNKPIQSDAKTHHNPESD